MLRGAESEVEQTHNRGREARLRETKLILEKFGK
jgi:hypothetical protein